MERMKLIRVWQLLLMTIIICEVLTDNIRTPEGNISSPGFPNDYHDNVSAEWKVEVDVIRNFNLIVNVWMEMSVSCKADVLQISHLNGKESITDRICGNQRDLEINFTGNGFIVSFQTDGSVSSKGFLISYQSSETDMSYVCDQMHNPIGTITTAVFNSPGRYPGGLNCTWSLIGPPNTFIRLQFLQLDMEYSGDLCVTDSLELNIPGEAFSEITRDKKFCGKKNPFILEFNVTALDVTLVTDLKDSLGELTVNYSFLSMASTHFIREMQVLYVDEQLVSCPFPLLDSSIIESEFTGTWSLRTQPGFNIHVHLPLQSIENEIQVFDGPEAKEYAKINSTNLPFVSKGFILTILFKVKSQNHHQNITFQSVSAFTSQNTYVTSVSGSSISLYTKFPTVTPSCCTYRQITTEHHKGVKLTLQLLKFSEIPDVDRCLYSGIYFYQNQVTMENGIGPFCDISFEYSSRILRNIVFSQTVFIAIYRYVDPPVIILPQEIQETASSCKGYFVKQQNTNLSYSEENFSMIISQKEKNMSVDIEYTEEASECRIVYFLPELWWFNQLSISLSGYFKYRICRYESPLDFTELEFGSSKYSTKEICSETEFVNHTKVTIDDIMSLNGKWSKEMSRLELGFFRENFCLDVKSCPNKEWNSLVGGCGILYTTECVWYLTLPEGVDLSLNSWNLKINTLFFDPENTGIQLTEYITNKKVLETNIWYRDLGNQRPWTYNAIHGANILLTPKQVSFMEIEFFVNSQKPYTGTLDQHPLKNHTQCLQIREKCLIMVKYEVPTSWEDARKDCMALDGDLWNMASVEDLNRIKMALTTSWRDMFYLNGMGYVYIGLQDKRQKGGHQWLDGSPLCTSDWYYPFDFFNNLLPHYPKLPIDPKKLQPDTDSTKRCVAMVPGISQSSTNWVKINCTEENIPHVFSICEIDLSDNLTYNTENNTDLNRSYFTASSSSLQKCSEGWIQVAEKCFMLITPQISLKQSIAIENAPDHCNTMMGRIANIQNVTVIQLRRFLQTVGLKVGQGDIWVDFGDETFTCISFSSLTDTSSWSEFQQSSDQCNFSEGRVGHVICESEDRSEEEKCADYQFTCDDGVCLTPDKVCDSKIDCSNGNDEIRCSSPFHFHCKDGEQVIPVSKYCDFLSDCEDGSDESECRHFTCSVNAFHCRNKQCVHVSKRCDHKKDCLDGSDEEDCDWDINCKGFKCPIQGCIPRQQQSDLHPDCPDKTDQDEHFDLSQEKRGVFFVPSNKTVAARTNFQPECQNFADHQRCHPDRSVCYPRYMSCVYDHDIYGNLRYCHNGAHLQHCLTYNCPGMFKCPGSYCLPYHKVCNGVMDCPAGNDEMNCNSNPCRSKLRCGKTNQCVSQEQVCDGVIQCKSEMSDEMFCDLVETSCPHGCQCFGYVMLCDGAQLAKSPEYVKTSLYRHLNFSRNVLSRVTNSTFQGWYYLASLDLSKNIIQVLEAYCFSDLLNLVSLDLQYNQISFLQTNVFDGLSRLRSLRLDGNPLHNLHDGCFQGLSSLPALNLSSMRFTELSSEAFTGLKVLKVLDLKNNEIKGLGESLRGFNTTLEFVSLVNNTLLNTNIDDIEGISVNELHSDHYRLCCLTNSTVNKCVPRDGLFSSCTHLISTDATRIFIWVWGIFAVLGNITFVIWRLRVGIHKASAVFTLNYCTANSLMGFYMVGLGFGDNYFEGNYSRHDVTWRTSWQCQTLKILSMLAWTKSLTSIEYLAIQGERNGNSLHLSKYVKSAWLGEGIAWILTFSLALYFGIAERDETRLYENPICSPLYLTNPQHSSINGFFVYNSIALVVITGTVMLGWFCKKGDKLFESNGQLFTADHSLIVFLNFVCLVLIIVSDSLIILGQQESIRQAISIFSLVIFPFPSFAGTISLAFINLRSKKTK